ncbi:MAG TPA: hypothetical protein VMV77_15155 [Bacteroidales bacterium]|nr:hypothetical protein [Bacteroidales bacterium]
MEIRKWTTVDVYYHDWETEKALKERKRLERLGYELQVEDEGNDEYDNCDQYLKSNPQK